MEAPQSPPYLVGNEERNSGSEGYEFTSTSIPGLGPGLSMCASAAKQKSQHQDQAGEAALPAVFGMEFS